VRYSELFINGAYEERGKWDVAAVIRLGYMKTTLR
jgi:hypothetical protein